jgi:WS/DGAT/MGAT family acyltransferase
MWVVDGVEGGKVGLISKMHHAAIDGVSGADLMVHLFDLSPEIAETPPPDEPWHGEPVPSDIELTLGALGDLAQRPAEIVRVMRSLGEAAGGMVSALRAGRDPEAPSPTLPFTAPRVPWNGSLTPHRSMAFAGCALDDLKKIKTAFGCTINDVVLAATAGTLRDWLLAHGGVPEQPLVASCPVSIGGGPIEPGELAANRMSSLFVALPVAIEDPVARIEFVRQNTKDAKELHGALGAETIMQLAEAAPPALANIAARLYTSSRLAERHPVVQNLVVSNVPGPPIPLYCAGARVLATYPMGPLIEGAGLNITVLSNMGNMDVGVIACRELVPDVWSIADGFVHHVQVLLEASGASSAPDAETTPGATEKV